MAAEGSAAIGRPMPRLGVGLGIGPAPSEEGLDHVPHRLGPLGVGGAHEVCHVRFWGVSCVESRRGLVNGHFLVFLILM
jgi:hypothetical protein